MAGPDFDWAGGGGIASDNGDVLAKFDNELTTGSARRRQWAGSDGDRTEFFVSLGNCLADRGSLGTNAQPVRCVFNVTAGERFTVGSQ